MKVFKYVGCLSVMLLLYACGGGTNRTNEVSFGNLQSFSQIGIGGEESSSTVSVTDLQNLSDQLVCNGIKESNLLLDDATLSGNPQTGANLCQANNNYITSNSEIFGFDGTTESNSLDSFVSSNGLGITGVNMYRIIYNTPGQVGYYNGGAVFSQQVSGLVLVPQGVARSALKGIVLYYHQTSLDKIGVPSFKDVETQAMLAAIYASQGYIVVAPDYVGQGINTEVMHPYVVFPQTNALDGLNMVRATRQFLASESVINIDNAPERLPLDDNQDLYITGYSEGGPYAIWASRLLQGENANMLLQNHLSLKHTVGMSGAYSLSKVMLPYAYAEVNNSSDASLNIYNANPGMFESSAFFLSGQITEFGKIESGMQQSIAALDLAVDKASLASYAFVSLGYYNFVSSAYSVFFPNRGFFNMSNCLDLSKYLFSVFNVESPSIVATACPIQDSLPNLFLNSAPNYNEANIAITIATSAMYNVNFFTAGIPASNMIERIFLGGASQNSVGSFAQPVATDPLLISTVAKADTSNYVAATKTSIIYLKYDSTVTNINSKFACSSSGVLGLSPSGMVKCIEIDNTNLFSVFDLSGLGLPFQLPLIMNHSSGLYPANLSALNEIRNNSN